MTPNLPVLTEQTIQGAIAGRIKKADEVFVAVSYIGKDGYQFFPANGCPESMKFLVDMSDATVSRGITNPMGVAQLLQLGEVRSLPCLHSKVLIFGRASAIVGSANLSTNSIENQFQCGLVTEDKNTVSELREWFKELWDSDSARKVNRTACEKAQAKFPSSIGEKRAVKSINKTKLKRWKNQSILEPIEFKIGLTASDIRRAIAQFKTCSSYFPHLTCAENALKRHKYIADRSKVLHALVKRINHWSKKDREKLFNLAFIDGTAAFIGKPRFLREPARKVRETINYLLFGEGEDSIRFEKVLSKDGRFRLEGLGRAGVAMLLHLWKPAEHGIWNNSVDKGFRLLKVTFSRKHSERLGQAYTDRIAALKGIMKIFNFRSLAETDSFVDAVAKGYIKL